MELVQEYPDNTSINYKCVWSFDLLGEEGKAVPFMKKVLS
jgi:hypothetical protein